MALATVVLSGVGGCKSNAGGSSAKNLATTDARASPPRAVGEAPSRALYVPADVAHPEWMKGRKDAQLASAASIAALHDYRFEDRIAASGIAFHHVSSIDVGKDYRAIHYDHGTGVAVADVDGDGLIDLYFVNQIGKNALYKNLAGGRFEDMTERAGVGVGDRACVGASFADVDNDGAPDLFVTSVRDGNLLFHNDGHGHFTDITRQAGVGGTHGHSSGAVFFDYDGDGWLDLFVTNVGAYTTAVRRDGAPYEGFKDAFSGHLHPERSERSILYHNLGGGRFEDVTEASGLLHTAWSGDASAFDYDGDGRPDLYVLAMQGHGELWHNLGGGHFEAVGRRVFPKTPWGSMGIQVLDWNGDGKLDLFVTDMHTDMATSLQPGEEKKKHDPATMFPLRFLGTDGNHVLGNALFTNQGDGKFVEMSDAANVETGWPWGASAADLNADGWPDLFVTAGMNYPFRYEGNSVLLNEGGKRFADAEFVLGIEPRSSLSEPWFSLDCDGDDAPRRECETDEDAGVPADPTQAPARRGPVTVWAARASRSSAIFDLDGDGDLDIVTNNYNDVPQIFVSSLADTHKVHSLAVRLVGGRSNRDGIGAVVSLRAGGRTQVQQNDGKSGYLSQSVVPLYFGLGDVDHADSITVRWPTGKEQLVRGPLKSGVGLVVKEP
jgi:enediyne biosynthesis protein E4